MTVETMQHGPVVLVTINRPERRNALDQPTIDALAHALDAAEADDNIGGIVLTGAGGAFSAGLDMAALAAGELSGTLADMENTPWIKLQRSAKVTLAAVGGPAVTGGLELALCCDIILASESGRFRDTHARVGVHPGGGLTPLLARAIGLQQAKLMSLSGRWVDAHEAVNLGLAVDVVPDDELIPSAIALVTAMLDTDPRCRTAMLQTYDHVAGLPLDEALAYERSVLASWEIDHEVVESRRHGLVEAGRRSPRP